MPGKAANFASQLTDLLDARAPKEVDAEDGMPQLDVADDWEHDLKEGLEHTKAKSKPLRMRGNLSQAFTTGAYKGRVVASDNAFTGEPEVEEELEDEGEEEDSAEGGEEGEESEEYSMDMDEEVEDGDEESEESEAAPAAKATKATKATKTSKADASESRAGLEHLKQVTIKARRRLQAEREAAEGILSAAFFLQNSISVRFSYNPIHYNPFGTDNILYTLTPYHRRIRLPRA